MVGTMVCLAAVTLGVDVGWEPSSDEGLEYIIQIAPEQLGSLRPGDLVIRSDVRPVHRGELRTFRIQVGTGALPQTDLPAPPPAKKEQPATTPPAEAQAKKVPATLPTAEGAKHIASPADYQELSPSEQLAGMTSNAVSSAPERSDEYFVPMMVVSGTAVGLLAALAYLSWIHIGTRHRYRTLLAEHMALQPAGVVLGQGWNGG